VPWQLAVLVGWVAAAATLVAWIWLTVWNVDGDDVRAIATREDDSRAAARAVVLGAGVASLFGVVSALLEDLCLNEWNDG
jgi:uncharacterized membrane protein